LQQYIVRTWYPFFPVL